MTGPAASAPPPGLLSPGLAAGARRPPDWEGRRLRGLAAVALRCRHGLCGCRHWLWRWYCCCCFCCCWRRQLCSCCPRQAITSCRAAILAIWAAGSAAGGTRPTAAPAARASAAAAAAAAGCPSSQPKLLPQTVVQLREELSFDPVKRLLQLFQLLGRVLQRERHADRWEHATPYQPSIG